MIFLIKKRCFMTKKFLALGLLLSSTQFSVDARLRHVIYDDMDDFWSPHEQFFNFFNQSLMPRRELTEAEKKAKKEFEKSKRSLEEVSPEISQSDNQVTIKFPITDVNKNDIQLSIKEGVVHGIIPAKYGKVAFNINSNYIETSKTLELKSEILEPKESEDLKEDKEHKDSKKFKEKSEFISLSSFTDRLPDSIEVNSVQASTKNNNFEIVFNKKKEKKINIKHSKQSSNKESIDSK